MINKSQKIINNLVKTHEYQGKPLNKTEEELTGDRPETWGVTARAKGKLTKTSVDTKTRIHRGGQVNEAQVQDVMVIKLGVNRRRDGYDPSLTVPANNSFESMFRLGLDFVIFQ